MLLIPYCTSFPFQKYKYHQFLFVFRTPNIVLVLLIVLDFEKFQPYGQTYPNQQVLTEP